MRRGWLLCLAKLFMLRCLRHAPATYLSATPKHPSHALPSPHALLRCCRADPELAGELGQPLQEALGFFAAARDACGPLLMRALREATGCAAALFKFCFFFLLLPSCCPAGLAHQIWHASAGSPRLTEISLATTQTEQVPLHPGGGALRAAPGRLRRPPPVGELPSSGLGSKDGGAAVRVPMAAHCRVGGGPKRLVTVPAQQHAAHPTKARSPPSLLHRPARARPRPAAGSTATLGPPRSSGPAGSAARGWRSGGRAASRAAAPAGRRTAHACTCWGGCCIGKAAPRMCDQSRPPLPSPRACRVGGAWRRLPRLPAGSAVLLFGLCTAWRSNDPDPSGGVPGG